MNLVSKYATKLAFGTVIKPCQSVPLESLKTEETSITHALATSPELEEGPSQKVKVAGMLQRIFTLLKAIQVEVKLSCILCCPSNLGIVRRSIYCCKSWDSKSIGIELGQKSVHQWE